MNCLPQYKVQPHYTYNIPVPERPDSTDASEYAESSQKNRPSGQNTCFGLPYQDHNYGAPPPPTPPPSPPPPTRVNGISSHVIDIEDVSCNTTVITSGPQQNNNQDDSTGDQDTEPVIDDSITRCICDFIHDDGYMICCDRCSVWQHVDCMGVDRGNIPEIYYCERCEPRKLNKQRAVQLQTRKREILMIDTSATESENETKQLVPNKASRGRKKKLLEKRENNNRLVNGKKKNKKLDKDGRKSKKAIYQLDVKKSPIKNKGKGGRSPILSSGEEANAMPWTSEQYADTYEEAPGNHYSSVVLHLLASKKVNGQQNLLITSKPPIQLRAQLCRVSQFGDNKRGLEAVENLSVFEPLIEYKGNVMLREQYNEKHRFFQSYQPHVLFYSKLETFHLCIDATSYGNDARHIRRSCCSNAEVRHFLDGTHAYFYIYTTKGIAKGQEITIPFDFDYQECNYGVECACGTIDCVVAKLHRGITNNAEEIPLQVLTKAAKKQKKFPKTFDEPLHIDVSKSIEPKPPVVSPPPKRRRVSSHSQSASTKHEKSSTPATPVKEQPPPVLLSPKSPGLASPTISGSSDHEEDLDKKKLSREERKLAAIMKAFEKMEKREERRKEALSRLDTEKSQDSESESKCITPTENKSRQKVKTKTVHSHKNENSPPLVPILVKGKEKKTKAKDSEGKKSMSTNKKKTVIKTDEPVEDDELLEPEPPPVKEEPLKEEPVSPEKDIENFNEEISKSDTTESIDIDVKPIIEEEINENVKEIVETSLLEKESVLKEDVLNNSPPVIEEQESPKILVTVKDEKVISDIEEELPAEQPVKEEKVEKPKPAKKKKRGNSTPARRKTRVSSSVSTTTDSADDSNSVPLTPTTSTPIASLCADFQSSSNLDKAFKLPKTKKHLMNEWLNEKNCESDSPSRPAKVDQLEVNTMLPEEAEVDFVRCVPSPHTNTAFSHMRRSSVSSNVSNHTKAVNSIPGVQLDTSMGSAKKRWLRQAMFERSSSAPTEKGNLSGTTSPVVNSSSTSPATSPPVDFMTPLKKRRLARESLSLESPYIPTPSTPTHNVGYMLGDSADASSVNSEVEHTPKGRYSRQNLSDKEMPDSNKNGICQTISRTNFGSNFSENSTVEKHENEAISEVPVTVECTIADKFELVQESTVYSSRNEEFLLNSSCECDRKGQNDLKTFSSEGFSLHYNKSDNDIIRNNNSNNSALKTRTLLIEKREEPSTSRLELPQNESNFSVQDSTSVSSELTSFTSDYDISHGEYSNKQLKTPRNHIFCEKKTDEGIDSSSILSCEKGLLNISQDSGLISDQEKTCSSSCNESNIQEFMSSSFDSVHSGKDNVESSQEVIHDQSESECEASTSCNTDHVFNKTNTLAKYNVADSSKDQLSCTIARYSKTRNSEFSMSKLESCNEIDSVAYRDCGDDSVVITSLSDDQIKTSDDNAVSCSLEEGTAEAEAKLCSNDISSAQSADGSVDFPLHSTNFTFEVSEKEEGEITDDDEDVVGSSNTVNDELAVNVSINMDSKDEVNSSEVNNSEQFENVLNENPEELVMNNKNCDSRNLDLGSSQNEVSSSRSTSPYWDISYRNKHGWWKNEKEALASDKSPKGSQSSSPSADHYHPSPQSFSRDLKADEDYFVDSTSSERDRLEKLTSVHSTVVSSTDLGLSISLPRDRSISVDSSNAMSPGSAADSITSPGAAKKKVSLLEYRKRMKQRSQDSTSSSSCTPSSNFTSKSSSRSTPSTPLYHSLPVFSKTIKHRSKENSSNNDSLLQDKVNKKRKDEEVKWSATATMAERIREQTQLTLTERLRREFGLDTVDESEDNKDDDSDEEPPPPPPPPPPAPSSSTISRKSMQVLYPQSHRTSSSSKQESKHGIAASVKPHQGQLLHQAIASQTQGATQQLAQQQQFISIPNVLQNSSSESLQQQQQQLVSNLSLQNIVVQPNHPQIITLPNTMVPPPSLGITQTVPASSSIPMSRIPVQQQILITQPQSQVIMPTESVQAQTVQQTPLCNTSQHGVMHSSQIHYGVSSGYALSSQSQVYSSQNVYPAMQSHTIKNIEQTPVLNYTSQEQTQPDANKLSEAPPLPLEPQPSAPQLPSEPQPHTPPTLSVCPKPPVPPFLLTPQTPTPQLSLLPQPPQPPQLPQPVSALLPTPNKAPLLPTPQSCFAPNPQPSHSQIPILAHSALLPTPAQHSISQSSLLSKQQSGIDKNVISSSTNVQNSQLLHQANTISSVYEQNHLEDGSSVSSLLPFPTIQSKGYNSFIDQEVETSGLPVVQGTAVVNQTYTSAPGPLPESSSATSTAQSLYPGQPPLLVNYNHGYNSASAFPQ